MFMSSLRRHARFSVCVLKENARLCHPFRDMAAHYELMVIRSRKSVGNE